MRVDFTSENKSKGSETYPKFKLEKDESARVSILESPMLKFVHVLRAPVVDPVTGEHQKIEKTNAKNETYETDAYEFVTQVVCDGDYSVVRENEVDPANCSACKDVADNPGKFNNPEAKYVAHIVQYKTQQGSLQPQEPFQAQLLLWVLTQKKFDKIVNIAAEFGDPRTFDLAVGPCKSGQFQTYEMAACNGGAVWQSNDSAKNFVSQLMQANAADEQTMTDTVARPLRPTQYAADSAKVLDRWGMIGRPQAQTPGAAEFGGMAQASQAMAAQSEQPAPWSQQAPPSFGQQPEAASAPAQSPPSFAQQPQAPAQEAPAQPEAAQAPAQQSGGGEMNFADLMAQMNGGGQTPQQ